MKLFLITSQVMRFIALEKSNTVKLPMLFNKYTHRLVRCMYQQKLHDWIYFNGLKIVT